MSIAKEYVVLVSYMFNIEDISELPKLQPDHFSTPFTRLIADTINKLIEKHDYCDDFAVEAFARSKPNWNDHMWIDLITTSPIVLSGVNFYLKWIKYEYAKRKLKQPLLEEI
jgi:replicative DNA helicase